MDVYPRLAALAGASIAKCEPLDGVSVWDTNAERAIDFQTMMQAPILCLSDDVGEGRGSF